MASKRPQNESQVLGRCPICKEPTNVAYRPFCSQRCRDVDLSRWLGGGYAIPGGQADADEDGEDAAAGQGAADRPGPNGKDGSD